MYVEYINLKGRVVSPGFRWQQVFTRHVKPKLFPAMHFGSKARIVARKIVIKLVLRESHGEFQTDRRKCSFPAGRLRKRKERKKENNFHLWELSYRKMFSSIFGIIIQNKLPGVAVPKQYQYCLLHSYALLFLSPLCVNSSSAYKMYFLWNEICFLYKFCRFPHC